jgi:hypothetical protein
VTTVIVSGGLYAGEHEVRLSQGRAYIHIPAKTVEGLISRNVKVLARVNAEKCEERGLHGLLLSFTATLVKAGRHIQDKYPLLLLHTSIEDRQLRSPRGSLGTKRLREVVCEGGRGGLGYQNKKQKTEAYKAWSPSTDGSHSDV